MQRDRDGSCFLAYELAYWVDHYLSHRIPLLWDFHKVHHTAEVLSPLTNFRVHPVDSIVFYNIVSISLGTTGGALELPAAWPSVRVGGANVILVAFIFVTVHLAAFHVWIATTGPLGRLILSPAHHQIHHSDNPIHFDKNFGAVSVGSGMAVRNALYARAQAGAAALRRQGGSAGHHTAMGGLVAPFVRAGSACGRRCRRRCRDGCACLNSHLQRSGPVGSSSSSAHRFERRKGRKLSAGVTHVLPMEGVNVAALTSDRKPSHVESHYYADSRDPSRVAVALPSISTQTQLSSGIS